MNLNQWLESALADADRRGLAPLKPLLEGFFQGTETLRAVDWGGDLAAELLKIDREAGGEGSKGRTESPSR